MGQRALVRFGRFLVAISVAAALAAAAENLASVPIDDPLVKGVLVSVVGAMLSAGGKWLRDRGWTVWVPV